MKRQKTIKDLCQWLQVLDEIESYYKLNGGSRRVLNEIIDSIERLLVILNSVKSKKLTDIEEAFIIVVNKWRFNEVVTYNNIKIGRYLVKSLKI